MRVYLGRFYCGVIILSVIVRTGAMEGSRYKHVVHVSSSVTWSDAPSTAKSLLLQLENNSKRTSMLFC